MLFATILFCATLSNCDAHTAKTSIPLPEPHNTPYSCLSAGYEQLAKSVLNFEGLVPKIDCRPRRGKSA
jgi:hypothetical protein